LWAQPPPVRYSGRRKLLAARRATSSWRRGPWKDGSWEDKFAKTPGGPQADPGARADASPIGPPHYVLRRASPNQSRPARPEQFLPGRPACFPARGKGAQARTFRHKTFRFSAPPSGTPRKGPLQTKRRTDGDARHQDKKAMGQKLHKENWAPP